MIRIIAATKHRQKSVELLSGYKDLLRSTNPTLQDQLIEPSDMNRNKGVIKEKIGFHTEIVKTIIYSHQYGDIGYIVVKDQTI